MTKKKTEEKKAAPKRTAVKKTAKKPTVELKKEIELSAEQVHTVPQPSYKISTQEHPAVLLVGDEIATSEFTTILSEHGCTVLAEHTSEALKRSAKNISMVFEFSNLSIETKKNRLIALDTALPANIIIISSSHTVSVLEQAQWIRHKERLVGMSALPTLLSNPLIELASSLYTHNAAFSASEKFFSTLKKETAIVQDRIGMVMPRILCQIINEAFFAMQSDVALPKDIDVAMKKGTNYPHGPIEWGEKIGFQQVVATLEAIYNDTREERNRVCPLLRKIALAGKFW